VRNRTTAKFRSAYADLPAEVRTLARETFQYFEIDPLHPSLHFKKVGRFWSARVGLHYRVLAVEDDDGDMVWFFIGSHAEYDRLIRRG
jgi:hypothetical protein